MSAHAKEFSVKGMCRVLNVARSGYYAWCQRPTSQREQANQRLLEQIRAAYKTSRQTYGSPRIHAYLRRIGVFCGRNRVARLMHADQLVGRKAHRRCPITTQQRIGARTAPNLLAQDFSAQAPNQKWVTDITFIDTSEGWLYLASVLDLYSRRIVGWAMADRMDAQLVDQALKMAWLTRRPASGLLHHSDRGCQYTSDTYQNYLSSLGCTISMSRTGNCYDNAAMESFFATLKVECAQSRFTSHAQARTAIFEFIEHWYNRCRLHSSLDYKSPVEYEVTSGH
ncbi:MAG: IS3 family transposase [Anaerolineaceae bacterium]|jgi:transposase InsO family protein